MNKGNRKNEFVARTSANVMEERLAGLKEIFPEIFIEGRVDLEKLQTMLGGEVDSRPERYSFTWAGKRDAIRLLQTPSRSTLIPCPEESVNFEGTSNLFIEGDNLEVMKLIYNSYFGRVKMIYIDPPYNTGTDKIYPDNFTDPLDTYLRLTGQKAINGDPLTTNKEKSGRYHSSWLSMMYPRLFIARQLLKDDGVIFISIDKREEANLRLILNEIFGEENFISSISVVSNWKGRSDDKYIASAHEFLLMYHKGKFVTLGLPLPEEYLDEYPEKDENGQPFRLLGLRKRGAGARKEDRPKMSYPFYVDPESGSVSLDKTSTHTIEVRPKLSDGSDGRWRWGQETSEALITSLMGKIVSNSRWDIFEIDYAETEGELRRIKPKSIWMDKTFSNEAGTLAYKKIMGKIFFENPKPPNLIKQCLIQSTSEDDIILDFFAGSCSTAQAVFELNREDGGNRRFIMVQLPEPTGRQDFPNISEIGKERIRRVITKITKGKQDKLDLKDRETPEDLGFKVFKLAESNYKQWPGLEEKEPESYVKQMELFTDPLVEGWQPGNVMWEVIIKEGLGLNARIEPVEVSNNTIYRVTDSDKGQSFLICLDGKLEISVIKALGLGKDDLFICLDLALDDETAANLALQCRLKTI